MAGVLRAQIEKGAVPGGEFLPSERELARTHRVGSKTARRALKLLEAEGLVKPEDRRGYRVLARANDPDRGCPLAFVVSSASDESQSFVSDLLSALQGAAGRRKWSLLGVQINGRSTGEVVEHLRAARVCGAVVDDLNLELLEQVRRLGIPVVLADAWLPTSPCDAVVQDSFAGAYLAADWLVARGHRRIAFVGPSQRDANMPSIERHAGAIGGLSHAGQTLDPALLVQVPMNDLDAQVAAARKLLARRDRPTGVLALWQGIGQSVARAAREMGLVIGKDLDLVGWSVREDAGTQELLDQAGPAAKVLWSAADLAELCMVRLLQRRTDPHVPVSLTRVPVRLQVPDRK